MNWAAARPGPDPARRMPTTHSKRTHDRWDGGGPLTTDYGGGIAAPSRAPPAAPDTAAFPQAAALDSGGTPFPGAGYAGRKAQPRALPQQLLQVPCVCGAYAVDLDESGRWLDFAFVGEKRMHLSIAVEGGRFRYGSGHNGGLTVGELGNPHGTTGYKRDRGHTFAALAGRASELPQVPPGRYRFGTSQQWLVKVERSDQIGLTFYKVRAAPAPAPAPAGGGAAAPGGSGVAADWYWADRAGDYTTSFPTDGSDPSTGRPRPPVRQAGQMTLRPDGGLLTSGIGGKTHTSQCVASSFHGVLELSLNAHTEVEVLFRWRGGLGLAAGARYGCDGRGRPAALR